MRLWAILPCLTTAVCVWGWRSGWAAILAYHTVIFVALIRLPRRIPLVRRHRWSLHEIAPCLGAALLGPALYVLLPLLLRAPLDTALSLLGLSGSAWLLFLPYFALVNPLLEELFWRDRLACKGREELLRHSLFAAYHLFALGVFLRPAMLLLAFASITLSSLIWSRNVRRAGCLLPALISHFFADIAIIAAVALFRLFAAP